MTIRIKGDMPVNYQLKPLKVGSDYAFTITFKDDNLVAKNTTGWTMQITGKANNKNGEQVFNLTIGSGITHTPAEGKFVCKISDTITLTIDVSTIVWDCKVVDGNGDVTYPLEGSIDVKETVTL